MSAEEYWEKDCDLVIGYREANNIKIEQENQRLWLQGLYNYKAFSVVISQAFGDKKGQQEKYFEYPIPITENEIKQEKERNVKKTLEWIAKGQKNECTSK